MNTPRSTLHAHIETRGEPWDHARIRSISGRETISDLFSFDIEVVCDADRDLPEDAYPGAEACLVIEADGEELRRVHGIFGPILSRLEATGDHLTHRLRLAPRALRLSLVETQEIFQDLSVPEILARKLRRHGFGSADFEMRLLDTYPAREFVVQTGESDLAFVCRLAEHHGISFFFEHDAGCDKLCFTDFAAGFRPVEGADELPFRPRGEAQDVFALEMTRDLAPTNYVVQDYNHRTPRLDPIAHFALESGNGGGVVEYGAHVKTPDEAARLARIRAEERLSRQHVYAGKSSQIALSAGRRVTLLDHPRLTPAEGLLPVEVVHELTLPVFDQAAEPPLYHNTFRAVRASIAYRPARRTPKPRIPGLVTGIIQPGPDGETGGTAKLDAEGRYTVAFHFDIAEAGAQKASRPVRMAQPFGGMGHGMHFPLRPGTEVAVGFVNGDPDRPVILGALYNAEAPSPVAARNASTNRITTASGAMFEISERR